MKQRILAIFLSLCMMIGLLPATAFAADGGELVIGDSPVIITDGGYSQGNLVYDEETASIIASVGDGVETPVGIGEGEVVIVPECICATEPGSLTMITESQSLTTIDGEATLELEATYSPEECILSDGSHGEYENISYEITKVMKNEQSMSTEQYADIAGNTLTVYGDDNEDPYTVYVRAKCGDVENEVYSDEIAITVNTFTSTFVSAFVSNAPERNLDIADGELDIADGSIVITDSGYAQGVLKREGNDLVVRESADDGAGMATETEWNDSPHAVTIKGISSENMIVIKGGDPEITLQNVDISLSDVSDGYARPAVLLYGAMDESYSVKATINLVGENVLSGYSNAPAIQINKEADLTIQGDDLLDATGSNNCSAIGPGNNSTAQGNAYGYDQNRTIICDNNLRFGGHLTIESGNITANCNAKSAGAIGDSFWCHLGSITINDGSITLNNKNGGSSSGLSAGSVAIHGGVITDDSNVKSDSKGIVVRQSFEMTSGTLLTEDEGRMIRDKSGSDSATISIIGGNIGKYEATKESGDRVRTELLFLDEKGDPWESQEVTVKENENSWSAYTDDSGRITTYLAADTDSISVDGKTVAIENGKGFIGPDCTCDVDHGTLTMKTKSQRLTTVNGTATLSGLEAVYEKNGCVLPDGFHGEYENIQFEISEVIKNGQYMPTDQYAGIDKDTLTVYGETNQDPYTVYVWAKCGNPGNEVYSDKIAIDVDTYVSGAQEGELDISNGSIIITETGYSQGKLTGEGKDLVIEEGTENAWSPDGGRKLTITGTNTGGNMIVVKGGSTEITLRDVDISFDGFSSSYQRPAVLLYGAADEVKETKGVNVTINLEGNNTLDGYGNSPAIQINKNAELTIQGNGTLHADGSNQCSAIGPAAGSATSGFAYGYKSNGSVAVDNNLRFGGSLVIENGNIEASSNAGIREGYGAAIGDGYWGRLGSITIKDGNIVLNNTNGSGTGLSADNITIEGGIITDNSNAKSANRGIVAHTAFQMSAGSLLTQAERNIMARGNSSDATIAITGGNIGNYTAENVADSRVLTKLYFVAGEDGTPVANKEVTVTEGVVSAANTWKAYTDENGVITTYLANTTSSITIDYADETSVPVNIPESHQALIGGTCSCSTFTDITWETGLPESITLHNLTAGEEPVSMNYDVPAAQLVTDKPCNMPIHPSLPEIEYELSVTTNEGQVIEGNLAEYARFENNYLTLLPGNAPYTVTLTAKAGDGEAEKKVPHSIRVNKGDTSEGETGEISTINLALGNVVINYTEGGYTYTQGATKGTLSSGTILITGFAPEASVTVNGGSPTLIINQNNPDDVWTIYSGENAGNITLQPRSFNDKLRFGAEGSSLPELSYVSATGKMKLNPDQGNITFNENDSVTQGKFTIAQLKENIKEYAVMGGDTEAARTVTNNSSAPVALEINGERVELAASGGSHIIPQAEGSKTHKTNLTTKTYLFGNDDGTKTLIVVGEGNAQADGFDIDTQYKITTAILDKDFSGTLYVRDMLYSVNLNELHAEQFRDIVVAGSMLGHVYIGPNVTDLSWGNYCMTTGFTVDQNNPAYTTDDRGALYSKDYSTLVVLPSQWTGEYTTREECTTIGTYATMRLSLDRLTIGKNVKTIEGGSYPFYSNKLNAIYVEAGNQNFASKDGILYDKDMTYIIACPSMLSQKEFTVPETVTGVRAFLFENIGIEKLTIPAGVDISGDKAGFTRMYNLKEVELLGSYKGSFDGAELLEKITVADGFDFNGNTFAQTSMRWIKDAGITVTGGEDVAYTGQPQQVKVTSNLPVEYSMDGSQWSEDVPAAVSAPGTYTVYWRIKKPADETYDFERVLYSSRTFTIGGLEASEDWFTLSEPVTESDAGTTTPVTLHKPAGAPSLEGGYTVKYSKDGTGEATEIKPAEAGSYLVTVDITADGYVKETLTLGNYVILSEGQKDSKVISFVTNGGEPIDPIIAASGAEISIPKEATRAGYIFAGWYSDSALRDRVESLPTTMPGEHTTYYAKWTRDAYTITYHLDDGTVSGNPEGYTAETPTFTLKNPTKAGYEFTGWTGTDLSEPTKEVTIEKGSSGYRVYTANWEKITYTIDYPKDYDEVEGNPKEYTLATSTGITLNQPADRQGYTFIGWSMVIDNNSSYILPKDKPVIPAGTYGYLTLTGIWLAENQTLTFHANGGKFADGTETYVISGAYDSPLSLDVTNPTRSGYNFHGWFTDKECTQLFDTGSIETMPLSMDIYAGWKKKSSSSSESTEGSGTSSVSDHVVITTNSGKLTDSQIEEAVKKAEKDSVITIQAVKSDEVVLRAGAMEALVENENDLLIQLRDGEVTLPEKAMKGLIDGAKSGYEIVISLEEQTSSDDATVSELLEKGAVIFDVVITVNGKEIHSFDKGLTLAFKVPGLKDMEEPVVLHLLQDGEQESYKPDEISGDTLTIKGIKNLSVFAVLSGNEEKAETENPFADVFENDYYFNSVLWAVTNGVTAGTSDITFSPDVTVSRAQMVTFLWRAAGSPAAEGSNPFTDVSVSDYYYNAVLWAVANGVTAGTSDTTFSPDAPVSRAQAVTFQWRAAGGPAVSGESFTDIPEGAYYGPAVTWAVANGITSGTGDHQFSPDAPVSRAQAVTFLYRQYK